MKRFLLLLIGILVFILWLYYVDPREMWQNIRTVSPGYLAAGFLFFYLSYLFKIVRWQMILRGILPIPFWQTSKYYWACEFINNFMPLRLGEVSKAALLKKDYRIDLGQSFTTIAVDRVYGIFVRMIVLCCLPLLAINLYPFLKGYLLYATSLTACGLLLLLLLVLIDTQLLRLLAKSLAFLPPRWLNNVIHFVESSLTAVRKVHNRKRDILTFLFLSAFGLIAQAMRTYFFFRAVGLEVPLPVFLITTTITDFLAILPQPPASVGTNEWYANIIYTFGLGISKNGVAGITLLTHAIILLILAFLGGWSLISLGYKILGNTMADLESDQAQMERRPIT